MSAPTTAAARAGRRRIPLAWFAVPLGLAGTGGAWTAAEQYLDAVRWPAELLFAASALFWAAFTVWYLVGVIADASVWHDLRHPLTGPSTAFVPVVAILLIAHYGPRLGASAPWLNLAAVALLAVTAAALLAHWVGGTLERDHVHPGYFLPVVAGAFIASLGFTSAGDHDAAVAAFGIGVFFWLVIGAVVIGRLVAGSPLPAALRPALSILLTPPATGSVAWFAASGGAHDQLQDVLGGIMLMMFLMQLFLLRGYLAVPPSMQLWTFTFPAAVLGNDGVRWLGVLGFDGWRPLAWIVLAVFTALVLAIAIGTLVRLAIRAPARGSDESGREAALRG